MPDTTTLRIATSEPPAPDRYQELRDRPEAGYSVADLCHRWKIGADKVHAFLRRGELVGVNVALNLSARPQWRITPEAVEVFERRRSSRPQPRPARRRRRKVEEEDFYP